MTIKPQSILYVGPVNIVPNLRHCKGANLVWSLMLIDKEIKQRTSTSYNPIQLIGHGQKWRFKFAVIQYTLGLIVSWHNVAKRRMF